ncbi:hypothetical protein TRVL_04339 [Trypanosoma vivax]|nr:hypothetical protein TRVL_04339 [Trypanosoma vivax]
MGLFDVFRHLLPQPVAQMSQFASLMPSESYCGGLLPDAPRSSGNEAFSISGTDTERGTRLQDQLGIPSAAATSDCCAPPRNQLITGYHDPLLWFVGCSEFRTSYLLKPVHDKTSTLYDIDASHMSITGEHGCSRNVGRVHRRSAQVADVAWSHQRDH